MMGELGRSQARRTFVLPLHTCHPGLCLGSTDPRRPQRTRTWNPQPSAPLKRSGRSTFWLLRQDDEQVLLDGLEKLRALGCSTVLAPRVGMFSVDVPAAISIDAVDAVFQGLVDHGVAIACPSLRHE